MDSDNSEERRRYLKRAALLGTGVGAAAYGGPAYLSLRRLGLARKESGVIAGVGGAKGAVVGAGLGLGAGLLTRPKRKSIEELSAKLDRLIEFEKAEILGPWQGHLGAESKIDEEHFPAGLSPAAALRTPLPRLMAYLNKRNILQQVF